MWKRLSWRQLPSNWRKNTFHIRSKWSGLAHYSLVSFFVYIFIYILDIFRINECRFWLLLLFCVGSRQCVERPQGTGCCSPLYRHKSAGLNLESQYLQHDTCTRSTSVRLVHQLVNVAPRTKALLGLRATVPTWNNPTENVFELHTLNRLNRKRPVGENV